MIKSVIGIVTLLCVSVAFSGLASADSKMYRAPLLNGYKLDWCYTWAKDCGQRAANAYCQRRGYRRASNFKIDHNVGEPTRLIGDQAKLCSSDECDSFRYIRCSRPDQRTVRKPKLNGYRLDWCFTWAKNCGRRVANAYCREIGFNRSTNFKIARNVGVPTRLIGDRAKLCSSDECDSFRHITCTK